MGSILADLYSNTSNRVVLAAVVHYRLEAPRLFLMDSRAIHIRIRTHHIQRTHRAIPLEEVPKVPSNTGKSLRPSILHENHHSTHLGTLRSILHGILRRARHLPHDHRELLKTQA